jgi:hypothetical protein
VLLLNIDAENAADLGHRTVHTAVGAPATNTTLMEASGGATLTVENTLNNTGEQTQNGSTVLIQNGTISGGTLTTSGTGSFQTLSGMLDGTVNIPTNAGLFTVSGRNNLNLKGTINNAGTIALDPTVGCLALERSHHAQGIGTSHDGRKL